MTFCKRPARCAWSLPFVFLLSLLRCAVALDFNDSLRSGKLPDALSFVISHNSKGSIASTPDGILLVGETNRYAHLNFNLPANGSDDEPLLVSVRIRASQGNDGAGFPGLYLYWDAKNYAYFRATHDNYLYYGWAHDGNEVAFTESNVMRDAHMGEQKFWGKEVFVRVLLVSRNLAFYVSPDGANWRRIAQIDARPGAPGAAPKIMLGRGFTGDNPDLCNDAYKDARSTNKSYFSDLSIVARPPAIKPDGPDLAKKETWDQTLAALEPAQIPRTWNYLSPATDSAFWNSKEWVQNDNWAAIKDAAGRNAKFGTWTKPEDEEDPLLDLRESVPTAKNSTMLLKTEIDWPVSGEAMLWFDSVEPSKILVNNLPIYASDGNEWWRERHPVKDRSGLPVRFNKGKNTLKVALRMVRGDQAFYCRVERNDPAYRIGLLQKMLEYFPVPSADWRPAHALLDLARRREESFDFRGALAGYSAALSALKNDQESRLRAFEGKLRVYAFLRDFDSAMKTAEEYLAAYPHEDSAASAMRAVLRFETLAGHAAAARERLKKWSAQGGPLSAVEMTQVIAGALAESGARGEFLATLDEIAAMQELKSDDRAIAALESGIWRWEYERQASRGNPSANPAEQTRAVNSILGAIEMLPGAKNTAVKLVVQDAKSDLQSKNYERAFGTAWGAASMALLASDADASYYFVLNQAHPISLPLFDKNKNEIKDQNQFREEAWNRLREKCGDPVWAGKWRIVAFKRGGNAADGDVKGPETNSESNARYGDKGWTEIEPEADKTERGEFGFDVRRFAGDAQVAYLAREFDVSVSGDTQIHLSNAGTWAAWVDGKPIGHDLSADVYKIEADRLPIHFEKGRHRLMVRVEMPAEGAVPLRARIGTEPQLAMLLYCTALAARQFPVSMADRMGELNGLRDAMARRTGPEALIAFSNAVSHLYDDQRWFAFDQLIWASQILHEMNQDAQSIRALRSALQRLEDGADYQGRAQKALELSRVLARALVREGDITAADVVLRDASNRHPLPLGEAAQCVAWRGVLRWEFGLSQAALPFFERCAREGRLPDEARQLVSPGLEWARSYRPERVGFEGSRDVQALLDAVKRQLDGAPDDVEKAMRGLSEILRNSSNSLVKVHETPFAMRFVGAREYIRAMLDAMPPAQRDVYQKVVGEAAAKRLKAVAENDPAELEKAALEFPHTNESRAALGRAGDLYFDRGHYGQAASLYQTLLREPLTPEQSALALAKLALAQAQHGQKAEGEAALKRLAAEFASVSVKLKGEPTTGSALAERLKKHVAEVSTTEHGEGDQLRFMGGLTRTGALRGPAPEPGGVVWAQPVIASGALERARSTFGIDGPPHLQSHPVTDGTRVFIGAMESLRAIELNSGNILWTQTWAGGSASANGTFTGFPSSCPLIIGGKVIVRAQSVYSSLKCFDAASGSPRWSSDAQTELRKLVWISDPAAAYGMVYAEYIEPGDFDVHGVAALDVETGRLRWRCPLASGLTGIKVGDAAYYQASNHLGPAAIDAGEIYIETGLASVAAINAFNGEARWVSSYPRMQLGDLRRGRTNVFDLSARMRDIFSSGPTPPMVLGQLVIAAPRDGNGVMAFDRRDGHLIWQRDMVGCRFVAGIAGGNILACDDGVTALNAETGVTAWRLPLEGQILQGTPTLSGAVLYLPTRGAWLRVDALKGMVIGSTPWDSRIGPAANALITSSRIVAVNERTVIGFATSSGEAESTSASALPYYDARRLEAEGHLEEAAQRYADALKNKSAGSALLALTARVRLLKLLGRRDEALAELTRFEHDAPPDLSAMGGLWKTKRDAVVRSLRRNLGETITNPDAGKSDPPDALNGVLVYSYFLPGENPQLSRFSDDPPNRVYTRLNGDIQALTVGSTPEVLWSSYVGTQVKRLAAGDSLLAAVGERDIAVLDRDTGETLSHVTLASNDVELKDRRGAKRRVEPQGEAFVTACAGGERVYAASDARVGAWNAWSGKPIWERATIDERTIANGFSVSGGALVRVYSRRDEVFVTTYDCATGAELKLLPLDHQQRAVFTQDFHYLLGRMNGRLTCVDLTKLAVLWRKDFPDLDTVYATVDFTPDGIIRYAGPSRRDGNRHIVRYIDTATGNDAAPEFTDAQGVESDRGQYAITERGYKISRLKAGANGGVETVWTLKPQQENGADFSFARAFIAGPLFHCVFVRAFDNGNREQFFVRTLSWDSGQRVMEQVLPGTPLSGINASTGQRFLASTFIQAGGSLAYTTKEGIFFVRPRGATVAQAAESFQAELNDPAAVPERIKDVRRGLAGIEQPEAMTFITPANARIDGDLSEWSTTEPIVLSHRSDYVPLSEGAVWDGAGKLSAKIYTGWSREGVTVAVDVTDGSPCSPRPGAETTTGDRVRIVMDARDGENSAIDPNECFVGTLALVNGASFFTQESGAVSDNGVRAEGKAAPSVSGRGRQYEVFVPWAVLRRDSIERASDRREVRLGVAVYDGDESGTRGALQWGAGVTMPSAVPMWLGRLTLLDVSAEKVERYRQVIALAPGSAEALKFMRLILLSKRGPEAENERIQELEKFISEHPQSANTAKALSLLRETLRRIGEKNGAGRVEKFAKKANVPESIHHALDDGFHVWVYPDPHKPPQMIMFQFSNLDYTSGTQRAYWGLPTVGWGREGTLSLKKLGEIPKPGEWTELRVSALDFDLETLEIKTFALTASGGQVYFDRAACTAGGKETVLFDDSLPANWTTQFSEIKFVGQPHHDGAKSLTFVAPFQTDVYNTHFYLKNNQPIIDFQGVRMADEAVKNPAKYQETCRKAAQIIHDTPEGLAFLRRAMEMTEGDEKTRCAKAVAELRDFMKRNMGSPNAYDALHLARSYFERCEAQDPMAKCAEFIADVKPPLNAVRAFYGDFAPGWMEWRVLGPFSAVGERRGMETSMEPERAVDLAFKSQNMGREIAWKKISGKNKNNDPVIDLRAQMGAERESYRGPYFGYAYTKFNCPTARKALLAFGADDVISIWVNGKRVVNELYTSARKDKETAEVQLRSGENEILIKVGVQRDRLLLVFRLADLDGRPFDDVRNE